MARDATVVWGIRVPDYVTNKDLYVALNAAGDVLEASHIDVDNMVVEGLPSDGSVTPIREDDTSG